MAPSSWVKPTPAVSSASLSSPFASRSRIARMDARPAVDSVGSLMPSRSVAHSGCPRVAQMSGWLNAPSTSSQPRSRVGHPNACATGRRTASTTGDDAMLGESCGRMFAVSRRLAATSTHRLESGAHTSGRGPSRPGSQPGPSAAATSLERLSVTVAATHRPSTDGASSVHCRASPLRTGNCVAEDAMVTVTGWPVHPCGAVLPDLITPSVTRLATPTRPTTAIDAGTTHRRRRGSARCVATSAPEVFLAIAAS